MRKLTDDERKMVEDNHGLIYGFLRGRKLEPDRFYDPAAIGLIKAVMAYDPEKGTFSSYAYGKMRGEVSCFLRVENAKRYGGTGVRKDGIKAVNVPIDSGDNEELLAGIASFTFDDVELKADLEEAMKHVPAEWMEIVRLVYLGYNTRKIAEMKGCSHQNIDQKLKNAQAILKRHMRVKE